MTAPFNLLTRYPPLPPPGAWVENVFNDRRICRSMNRLPRYYDEPFLHQFGVRTPEVRSGEAVLPDSDGAGISFDESKALIKCAGEAAERHSLSRFVDATMPYGSFRELAPALNPDHFQFFSDEQLATPPFAGFRWDEHSPFYWIAGESLLDSSPVLLPAQLTYMPLVNPTERRELCIFHSSTTGAACGQTREAGTLSGILELLERDAFMVHYLSRTPGVAIETTGHPLFDEITAYLNRFGLTIQVFHLETDFPFCSTLALLTEETRPGSPTPWMSSGLKCSPDPIQSVLGSIEEACQTRPWIRHMIEHCGQSAETLRKEAAENALVDRAMYWAAPKRAKDIDFFLKTNRRIDLAALCQKYPMSSGGALDTIVEFCRREGHPIYRVDITKPEVAEHGLIVSRVMMPTVQQFYLVEPHIPLRNTRWQTVPVKLGLLEETPAAINPIPHFFL